MPITCFGLSNGSVAVHEHGVDSRYMKYITLDEANNSVVVGLHPYHYENNIVISAMNSQVCSANFFFVT